MTQLGESVAVTNIADPDKRHWAKVEYQYKGGKPVQGSFIATDSEGLTWAGVLNDKGEANLNSVPAGSVEFELIADDSVDDELKQLRAQIKQVLDGIVAEQKKIAAADAARLAQQDALGKTGIYAEALGKGIWNGAVGLVTFAKDTVVKAAQISNYLNPFHQMHKVVMAAYSSHQSGDMTSLEWRKKFLSEFQNEQCKELAEILGFDPRILDAAMLERIKLLIAEAYELTAFIADDPETHDLLLQFAKDYAGAQSSVQWTEFAGGGIFELVLTVLLCSPLPAA